MSGKNWLLVCNGEEIGVGVSARVVSSEWNLWTANPVQVIYMCMCTHTHTHIYIYIYIIIGRLHYGEVH